MICDRNDIETEEAIFEMFDRLDDIFSGTNELKGIRDALIIKEGESA